MALEERRGDRQPGESKPSECGQDEDPDEQADRQEDDDADCEGGQKRSARRTLLSRECAGADVGEREEGRTEDEQRRLDVCPLPDRELVEDRHDRSECQRRKETAPVEPDRFRDELANRPIGSRNFSGGLGHERGRYSPRSA